MLMGSNRMMGRTGLSRLSFMAGSRNGLQGLQALGQAAVRTNPNPPTQIYYQLPNTPTLGIPMPGPGQTATPAQQDAYWTQFSQQTNTPYWGGVQWYVPGMGVPYYKDYQGNPIMFNPNNPLSFNGAWQFIPYQNVNPSNPLPGSPSEEWQNALGNQRDALNMKWPCNTLSSESAPDPNLPRCSVATQNFPTSVDFTIPMVLDATTGWYMIGDYQVSAPSGYVSPTATDASTATAEPDASNANANSTALMQQQQAYAAMEAQAQQTTAPPQTQTQSQAQQAVQSGSQVISAITPLQVQTSVVPVSAGASTAPPLSASTTYASDYTQPSSVVPIGPMQSVAQIAQSSSASGAGAVASDSTTTDITDWISQNPLLAAGIAAAALFLFTK